MGNTKSSAADSPVPLLGPRLIQAAWLAYPLIHAQKIRDSFLVYEMSQAPQQRPPPKTPQAWVAGICRGLRNPIFMAFLREMIERARASFPDTDQSPCSCYRDKKVRLKLIPASSLCAEGIEAC